jgi:hypothetical protein
VGSAVAGAFAVPTQAGSCTQGYPVVCAGVAARAPTTTTAAQTAVAADASTTFVFLCTMTFLSPQLLAARRLGHRAGPRLSFD